MSSCAFCVNKPEPIRPRRSLSLLNISALPLPVVYVAAGTDSASAVLASVTVGAVGDAGGAVGDAVGAAVSLPPPPPPQAERNSAAIASEIASDAVFLYGYMPSFRLVVVRKLILL